MIDTGILFAVIFFGLFILTVTILVFWHILHFILCRKYDAQLFIEPYFRTNELTVYSSWPLSLFRSMAYILLLGVPMLAKKRRFKKVKIDIPKGFLIVFFCKLFLSICILDMVFFLAMIAMGISSYLPNAGQPG